MRIKYIIIVTCLLTTFGCKKIDRFPEGAVAIAGEITPAIMLAATNGNYARVKNMAVNMHRAIEFPGDNVSLSGVTSSHLTFVYDYRRIPTNSIVTGLWSTSYQIIVAANKLIEAVPEGQSANMDQMLGENYFLRALMHFYLVNTIGKPYSHGRDNLGVPIKLDSDPENIPARSTVGEVYDQMLADLTKAESLMSVSKANIYASKEVVWAFFSRLYLYMEDNEKAADYATDVINSNRYQLVPTADLSAYGTKAPETNKETIFAIKYIPNADYTPGGFGNIGAMYSQINGEGYGEMYASKTYLDLVMRYPTDERNKFIFPIYKNNGVTRAYYTEDAFPYNYKSVVVTQSGDDYLNGGTPLEKEMSPAGHYNYFITDGSRKQVMILPEMEDRNGFPRFYIYKCSLQDGQAQLWSPIIFRLAEMYLNRAEANAKLGNDDEAYDDLNLIRDRAGIPAAGLYDAGNLPSGQTLLEVILDERRLEFAWEGQRKSDVFRNKMNMNRKYPGTHLVGGAPIEEIQWTANNIIEFVPESQMLVHEGLVQNPL